jgi:hypothetical protein
MSAPQLRLLVARFLPRRSGLDPKSGYAGSVVGKVAVGKAAPSTSVSSANSHSNAQYSSTIPRQCDMPSSLRIFMWTQSRRSTSPTFLQHEASTTSHLARVCFCPQRERTHPERRTVTERQTVGPIMATTRSEGRIACDG